MVDQNDNFDNTQAYTALTKETMVSHYRIIHKIGAGGMGEVYLAEDTKLNRQVALKFLPGHLSHDPEIRSRFTREAQAVAKLDHPNIVTIYEVSEFQNRPFFAMQYVEGKTLKQYCQEQSLSVRDIVELMSKIVAGIGKAHTTGIVHRDIKSANIIVDKDQHPKILDFGLAIVQGTDMLTKAGSTLGTVAYMSPEQAKGQEVDNRTDLFSLGVVMYELITGHIPFVRANDAATLQAVLNESAEPLSKYQADISPAVQRIVDKLLCKDAAERYQAADDLATDLLTLSRSMDSQYSISSGDVAGQKPSIAVLPFANMSADPENEFFSDGLTEELLNVLAKNPGLKVTGRTSSFAFKGKNDDLRIIGQKLGVESILEGSVRKAGNRVRITTQLVKVSDGFHLWSETYDRVLDDIFAVQDDIAAAVSKAMHVTLVGVDNTVKKVNPESFELTLRANQQQQQMNVESTTLAVELYKRAIEIDPDNARAYAGLSFTYAIRVAYGHALHKDEYLPAKEAAEKALELDDQLPNAHDAMCWVHAALELQIKKAAKYIKRAYELAPNKSEIIVGMAVWELLNANFDRAIRLNRKALELDPLNPFTYRELGRTLAYAGKLVEAREAYEKCLQMSSDMTAVHYGLSMVLLLQGKYEEAERIIVKEKLDGYRFCGQALIADALGKREESDKYLNKLLETGDHWSYQIVMIYAYRGDIDAAFKWLEVGYEIRDAGLPTIKANLMLKPLHSDPRWQVLLKKMELTD